MRGLSKLTQLVRKNLDYNPYSLPPSPELLPLHHALLGLGAGMGLEARSPQGPGSRKAVTKLMSDSQGKVSSPWACLLKHQGLPHPNVLIRSWDGLLIGNSQALSTLSGQCVIIQKQLTERRSPRLARCSKCGCWEQSGPTNTQSLNT